MWHLWQQQQHLWHRDRHMEAFVFMFCSVSHAARYTHFHSKLVCRLTPPPPPSSLLPPHCTVGRVRPAAQPPAHPAVICNTIRFAAAVDSPARGVGGRGGCLHEAREVDSLWLCAASNAFFCSFALLPALRADPSWTKGRRGWQQLIRHF